MTLTKEVYYLAPDVIAKESMLSVLQQAYS